MKLELNYSCIFKYATRFVLATVLFLILTLLLMPLCSGYLLKGLYESRYTNDSIRVDVSLQGSKPNSLNIISDNNVQKGSWDKSGNTMVVQDNISSKWKKHTIRARVGKSGEIQIKLLGADKRVDNTRYPILVDYRSLKVNGIFVFENRQTQWHDEPFLYQLAVRDNEVVDISFEARRHHFRISDVTEVYKTNLWILLALTLFSFSISWKLVSYITKLKEVGQASCADTVFVCLFFGLLFVPMCNISEDVKSVQENRMLAKKPSLFNNTGGGYNLQYGKEVEMWFNDHFFGRELSLKLDKDTKYNIDRIYKNGNVLYIPDNGWMFNGYHLTTPSSRNTIECVTQLNKFQQFCKQNNIKLYILLVPYKSSVYHEILGEVFTYNSEEDLRFAQYVNQLREKTGIPILYPYEELRKARNEDYVFFKQSHHWTEWGAYQGYCALMKAIRQDFPDIQTISLSDYKKFTAKTIRDDWDRNFNTGHTTRLLGFSPRYAVRYLLKDEYTYYDPICGDNLMTSKGENTKNFKQKGGKYKILLTGNSQNENLLQFLPHSAHELKYIRFNLARIPSQEQPKLLKYYRKEIVDFKPDILVYCISAELATRMLPVLTQK